MTHTIDPTKRSKMSNKQQGNQAAIRFVRKDLDEEDVIVLESILILMESGLKETSDLSRNDCNYESIIETTRFGHYWKKKYDPREGTTNRGNLINYINFGDAQTGWKFHKKRVFEILSKLNELKEFALQNCASVRWIEIVSVLPNLKILNVWQEDRLSIPAFMRGLTKNSNLEELILHEYSLKSEDDLSKFLFDFLPFVPKLSTLSFGRSKIKSFQRFALTIQNNKKLSKTFSTSRLRRLDLGLFEYHHSEKREERTHSQKPDQMEVEAFKTILNTFPELHKIEGTNGFSFDWRFVEDVGLKYLRYINYVGRMPLLVEIKNCKSINCTIPLSLWPIILKRSYKLLHYGDGIYYLLKNMPEVREQESICRFLDYHDATNGIYYLLKNMPIVREGN